MAGSATQGRSPGQGLRDKEGPFEPKHAGVFAPWSPAADDPAASRYLATLGAAIAAADR